MKILLYSGLILATVVGLGCQPHSETIELGQPPKQASGAGETVINSKYILGRTINTGNFSVIPVYLSTDAKKQTQVIGDEYATLAEAKKNGWIEIIELPGEEEVNSLSVRNTGPRAILLLGGELLLGGKQDRIVAEDTIVPAGKTVEVPVYCVEHGRWSGPSRKFAYSGSMVPDRVRKAAMYEDQEEVWNKVSDYNSKVKVDDERTTVQAGLYDEKIQARVGRSLRDVMSTLSERDDVVGVVLLINGEIQTFELFGSNRLFANSIESLLRGSIAEAAVVPVNSKPIDTDECAKFVSESLTAKHEVAQNSRSEGNASVDGAGFQGRAMMSQGASGESKSVVHGSYSTK